MKNKGVLESVSKNITVCFGDGLRVKHLRWT